MPDSTPPTTCFCRHASGSPWPRWAPLGAHHFHLFSLLTPLVNLLVWPLALILIAGSLIMAPAALAGGPPAAALKWLTAGVSEAIEQVLEAARHIPGFVVHTAGPPTWWLALFYASLCAWVAWSGRRGGRIAFLASAFVLAGLYAGDGLRARTERALRATVADVGQGHCMVVRLPSGAVMLCDAGSSAPSRAEAVSGILWRERADTIGALVVSRRSFDRYSFLPHLAHRFRIERLLTPPLCADERPAKILDGGWRMPVGERRWLSEGARFSTAGLHCRVLHPDERFLAARGVGAGDRSLVLTCELRGWRMLLAGGAGEIAVQRLLSRHSAELRADVLLLPDGGRWSPKLADLLRAVRPAVAIASSPGPLDGRTLQATEAAGASVWNTAREGAIIMDFGYSVLSIRGYASGRELRLHRAPREAAVGLAHDGEPRETP